MFTGFSQTTVDFLWGIRFNNERPWFMEHKEEYQESLLKPMKELAAQVYDGMHLAYPNEPMMFKVSRIYRDARRLFGRGPYKDHLWFSIRVGEEDWEGLPTFWFEITPDGYSYGLGVWQAPAVQMETFRRYTMEHPEELTQIYQKIEKTGRFFLEGDEYAKKKAAPSDFLAPWFQKKSFALSYNGKLDEKLFHPQLADELLEAYKVLMPIYQYFSKIRSMVPVEQIRTKDRV